MRLLMAGVRRRLRLRAVAVAAMSVVVLTMLVGASAATAGQSPQAFGFTQAWGWGVSDGQSQFETCTSTCSFGLYGSGNGQFRGDIGAAVSGGNVFVVDTISDRVQEFTSSGSFVTSWGAAGSADGQFTQPQGIGANASGDVFVADTGNHRVEEFDSSGDYLATFGTSGPGQLTYPTSVTVDDSGNVYVADYGIDQVVEFTSSGAFVQSFGSYGTGAGQLNDPWGVAVDSSGDVFVAEYSGQRISEFNSSATFVKAWGWGVSDGAGQLETCTTSCLPGVAGGGDGQLNYPASIALSAAGNLYVIEQQGQRIDEFSTSGDFIQSAGWGVADGASYFETCDTGCQGGAYGVGAGQLDGAYGLTVDGVGDVYVADGSDRVDEFALAAPAGGTASISGTPQDGDTLPASTSSWAPSAGTYDYEWYDCPGSSAGSTIPLSSCTLVTGAQSPTYTLTPSDVGHSIEVAISGVNGAGTSNAVDSTVTGAVAAGPASGVSLQLSPTSITASGTSMVTATATVADAEGAPVGSDSVAFSSDGSQHIGATANLGGGSYSAQITSSTTAGGYTITASDNSVTPAVTATAPLTQTASPVAPPTTAVTAGTLEMDGSARASRSGPTISPGIVLTCKAGSGTCSATETATSIVPRAASSGAHRTPRVVLTSMVVGQARFTISAGRSQQSMFKLNRLGQLLLSDHKHVRVSVQVFGIAPGGKSATATKMIVLTGSAATAKPGAVKINRDGTVSMKLTVSVRGRIDALVTAWNDNLAAGFGRRGIHPLAEPGYAPLGPAAARFVVGRVSFTAAKAGTYTVRVVPNARGRELITHPAYRVTLRLWTSYTPSYAAQQNLGFFGRHPSLG